MIATESGLEIVGETGDGRSACRLAEKLRPDLVLLELDLPGLDGFEVLRHLARELPETRSVVLSALDGAADAARALRLGASVHVSKRAAAEVLSAALRATAAGRAYVAPPTSRAGAGSGAREGRAAIGLERLSGREREVLELVARGSTSREIALRLGISPRTAETHRANLQRKLGLRGQAELVRFALESGLLDAGR
jgi:DNA-binding NarL/FixJ family response regulator